MRVTFAGILSPTTASPVITTRERAPAPATFAYTGAPVAIPDNGAAGASVTIPVDGAWTFHVVDAAPVDIGSIRAVTLHVRDFAE